MGKESEDEDVTPTAVAKEVIGLRPRARYPNDEGDEKGTDVARGRRREGSSANEDNGDWRRLFDVAPLPRVPPIREGVSRPPPEPLPILREDSARGAQRGGDPSEIRVSYCAIFETSLALFRPFARERASGVCAATLRQDLAGTQGEGTNSAVNCSNRNDTAPKIYRTIMRMQL